MIYGGPDSDILFDGTVKPGVCDRNKTDAFAIYWVTKVWDGVTPPEDLFTHRATARDLFTDWNEWNGWHL
jgi:hypothetical protein